MYCESLFVYYDFALSISTWTTNQVLGKHLVYLRGLIFVAPMQLCEQMYVPTAWLTRVQRASRTDASVTHKTKPTSSINNQSASQTEQLITHLHASDQNQVSWHGTSGSVGKMSRPVLTTVNPSRELSTASAGQHTPRNRALLWSSCRLLGLLKTHRTEGGEGERPACFGTKFVVFQRTTCLRLSHLLHENHFCSFDVQRLKNVQNFLSMSCRLIPLLRVSAYYLSVTIESVQTRAAAHKVM